MRTPQVAIPGNIQRGVAEIVHIIPPAERIRNARRAHPVQKMAQHIQLRRAVRIGVNARQHFLQNRGGQKQIRIRPGDNQNANRLRVSVARRPRHNMLAVKTKNVRADSVVPHLRQQGAQLVRGRRLPPFVHQRRNRRPRCSHAGGVKGVRTQIRLRVACRAAPQQIIRHGHHQLAPSLPPRKRDKIFQRVAPALAAAIPIMRFAPRVQRPAKMAQNLPPLRQGKTPSCPRRNMRDRVAGALRMTRVRIRPRHNQHAYRFRVSAQRRIHQQRRFPVRRGCVGVNRPQLIQQSPQLPNVAAPRGGAQGNQPRIRLRPQQDAEFPRRLPVRIQHFHGERGVAVLRPMRPPAGHNRPIRRRRGCGRAHAPAPQTQPFQRPRIRHGQGKLRPGKVAGGQSQRNKRPRAGRKRRENFLNRDRAQRRIQLIVASGAALMHQCRHFAGGGVGNPVVPRLFFLRQQPRQPVQRALLVPDAIPQIGGIRPSGGVQTAQKMAQNIQPFARIVNAATPNGKRRPPGSVMQKFPLLLRVRAGGQQNANRLRMAMPSRPLQNMTIAVARNGDGDSILRHGAQCGAQLRIVRRGVILIYQRRQRNAQSSRARRRKARPARQVAAAISAAPQHVVRHLHNDGLILPPLP